MLGKAIIGFALAVSAVCLVYCVLILRLRWRVEMGKGGIVENEYGGHNPPLYCKRCGGLVWYESCQECGLPVPVVVEGVRG